MKNCLLARAHTKEQKSNYHRLLEFAFVLGAGVEPNEPAANHTEYKSRYNLVAHHESTQTKPAFSFGFQSLSSRASSSKFPDRVVVAFNVIRCQLPLHALDQFFSAPSNVHAMK
jgi:hypothetical protein